MARKPVTPPDGWVEDADAAGQEVTSDEVVSDQGDESAEKEAPTENEALEGEEPPRDGEQFRDDKSV
jgi:hypothetical protein